MKKFSRPLKVLRSIILSFIFVFQSFLPALPLLAKDVYAQEAVEEASVFPTTTVETTTGGELTTLVVDDKSAQSIENLDLSPETVVNNPAVITDKADYAPTDAVVISGTGFTANTT